MSRPIRFDRSGVGGGGDGGLPSQLGETQCRPDSPLTLDQASGSSLLVGRTGVPDIATSIVTSPNNSKDTHIQNTPVNSESVTSTGSSRDFETPVVSVRSEGILAITQLDDQSLPPPDKASDFEGPEFSRCSPQQSDARSILEKRGDNDHANIKSLGDNSSAKAEWEPGHKVNPEMPVSSSGPPFNDKIQHEHEEKGASTSTIDEEPPPSNSSPHQTYESHDRAMRHSSLPAEKIVSVVLGVPGVDHLERSTMSGTKSAGKEPESTISRGDIPPALASNSLRYLSEAEVTIAKGRAHQHKLETTFHDGYIVHTIHFQQTYGHVTNPVHTSMHIRFLPSPDAFPLVASYAGVFLTTPPPPPPQSIYLSIGRVAPNKSHTLHHSAGMM